jgi:hypothetical protein
MKCILNADGDLSNDLSAQQDYAVGLMSNDRRQKTDHSVTNNSQPRNRIPIRNIRYIITVDSTTDDEE